MEDPLWKNWILNKQKSRWKLFFQILMLEVEIGDDDMFKLWFAIIEHKLSQFFGVFVVRQKHKQLCGFELMLLFAHFINLLFHKLVRNRIRFS